MQGAWLLSMSSARKQRWKFFELPLLGILFKYGAVLVCMLFWARHHPVEAQSKLLCMGFLTVPIISQPIILWSRRQFADTATAQRGFFVGAYDEAFMRSCLRFTLWFLGLDQIS